MNLTTPGNRRLWLVGDDEALDALAELSQHLDYFSVARLDEAPTEPLSPLDHLVVGTADALRGPQMLADLLSRGRPGFAQLLEAGTEELRPGARAILMAATLLKLELQQGQTR